MPEIFYPEDLPEFRHLLEIFGAGVSHSSNVPGPPTIKIE